MSKPVCVLLLIVCSFFVSCNFEEELYLNDNGSGKISINFDGNGFMQSMGEEKVGEPMKAIDSTFHFKDFIREHKDSIATLSDEQQAKIKKLENFSMHMLMNEEKGEMKFELFTDFKSINEVGDMFGRFRDANAVGPSTGPAMQSGPPAMEENPTEVSYNFSKNKFTREARIVDSEAFEKMKSQLSGSASFLGGSKYKLTYHFPRKIKSISAEKATLSQDGKTMFLEVGLTEYFKDPKVLDITVELEK